MSLLPSRDPAVPDADPRVIGVDSEDADDVLAALSSDTARKLLAELHDEPAPPGELADRVDTSLQNAQYHLNKLENAGAIEIVDTAYSEKGREMDVYAPANQPLVICAGDEKDTSGLRSAITQLLGTTALLAVVSLAVQQLFGGGLGSVFGPRPVRSGSAGGTTPDSSFLVTNGTEITPTVTDSAMRTAADVASTGDAAGMGAGIPLGLAFFAGGVLVLLGLAAVAYFD